jgi:hypothetical protein
VVKDQDLLAQVRFSKKEAEIATAVYKAQCPGPREDISFAPVGLDEPDRVFISEDPIGLLGGINKNAYVANNPVNRIDPMGLATIPPGNLFNNYAKCVKNLPDCSKALNDCKRDCNNINKCGKGLEPIAGVCELGCYGDFAACSAGRSVGEFACELQNPLWDIAGPFPPVMPGK